MAFVALRLHDVILGIVGSYRLKRPRAHVQGERRVLDASRAQAPHQLRGEVQAGSRRRDGAWFARVDCLVAAAIGRAARIVAIPEDVWGQGHAAHRLQQALDVTARGEGQRPLATAQIGGNFDDNRRGLVSADITLIVGQKERQFIAGANPPRRPHHGPPQGRGGGPGGRGIHGSNEQNLDNPATAAAGPDTGRQNASIVDHNQVAGTQQVGEVSE